MSTDFIPPYIQTAPTPATLKIASDDTEAGFIIINASDFDAETMTVYGAEPKAKLPPVRALAAHLAELDAEAVKALQASDDRNSAAPIYAARLAELAK